MITWFGVRDETSSGILYSLQWLKGRLISSRVELSYTWVGAHSVGFQLPIIVAPCSRRRQH